MPTAPDNRSTRSASDAAGERRWDAIATAFAEFADTLVADFDVLDFLHQVTVRCSEVLGVSAAGVLLSDQRGNLRTAAASSERTHLLELLQLQTGEGPCPECFRTGEPVAVPNLKAPAATVRWPEFAQAASALGYGSVHALPMRLRGDVIGALNLFDTEYGPLPPATHRLGQALTDVATIGLLQARAVDDRVVLARQLRHALDSRVVIEQAKGVLAERTGLDMHECFELLRSAARNRNRRVADLARAIVDSTETR
ncbi:transcriptional regulator [Actinorhabdospora filicis]|uniref:Transcriptional regulator n=1 Tax=Actinorhabdospora filicis TaxID=1785913 RepID=A0A9W6SPA8_9ACTN|nr:GAF and ANTAR domain-containing protein [Actinorhabdospora filicis]GLZ79666.1 transcriptional regulator [Actinorhabdospora filicis]